jgi:hypothetical protein
MSKLPPQMGTFFAKKTEDLSVQQGEKMTINWAEARALCAKT